MAARGITVLYGRGGTGKGVTTCHLAQQLVSEGRRAYVVDYEGHEDEWAERLRALPVEGRPERIAATPGGGMVAVITQGDEAGGRVQFWRARDWQRAGPALRGDAVTFSPDGRHAALQSGLAGFADEDLVVGLEANVGLEIALEDDGGKIDVKDFGALDVGDVGADAVRSHYGRPHRTRNPRTVTARERCRRRRCRAVR